MHNLLIMVRLKLQEVSRTISKKSLLNEHETHKHLYNFQATVFIYLLLPFHFISSRVLLSFWIFDLVPGCILNSISL